MTSCHNECHSNIELFGNRTILHHSSLYRDPHGEILKVKISTLISVEVSCPHGSPGNLVCYRNGTSENGQLTGQCDKECLGGCDGQTQDDCYACANARLIGPAGGCRNQCPEPSLLVSLNP